MTEPDKAADINVERLIKDHAEPKFNHLTKEIHELMKLLVEKVNERARIELHMALNKIMEEK